MFDIVELMKTKLFLIGTILMMIAGVILVTIGGGDESLMMGIPLIVLGLLLFISGYITPVVSESKNGLAIGLILTLGAVILVLGLFVDYTMLIAGLSISILMTIAWPIICCQGSQGIKSQVIGVASAHDSISMIELSSKTGASVKLSSEIVYDAIGKGKLSGRMEGGTFVRSAPSTTSYSTPTTTTREREIVKVLVICPYCGAKTEQGIGKCQNCQADL
jgi:hypothetical protein